MKKVIYYNRFLHELSYKMGFQISQQMIETDTYFILATETAFTKLDRTKADEIPINICHANTPKFNLTKPEVQALHYLRSDIHIITADKNNAT